MELPHGERAAVAVDVARDPARMGAGDLIEGRPRAQPALVVEHQLGTIGRHAWQDVAEAVLQDGAQVRGHRHYR